MDRDGRDVCRHSLDFSFEISNYKLAIMPMFPRITSVRALENFAVERYPRVRYATSTRVEPLRGRIAAILK
jgi:hypothetical protein